MEIAPKLSIYISCLILALTTHSQNIFSPNRTQILNYTNNQLYKGNSKYINDIILTYNTNYLYKGRFTYSTDIITTIKDNKLYNGNTTYKTNLLITYNNKGQFYLNTQYHPTYIYTNNILYKGIYPYKSNIVLYTDKPLPLYIVAAIILSLN